MSHCLAAGTYWDNCQNDYYQLELPPIGYSSLAVDSVLPRGSAELGILQPLLIIMTLRL